ncbi:helix-turn-helix domain-containing protein [Natrononativus amylolyticus]|uniref:helix-turn-helix domain-containing protein n=1 Tax=Natrononativus amylolyticus TaxID=2963434 RepID=UPI0020CE5EEE|nr:helix-turn-helix domain-containing protein [Natrononativus amylolyticus]
MTDARRSVLELLEETDVALPVAVLDNELEPPHATVSRTLTELERDGLVERDERYEAFYRITDSGCAYLEEESVD